MSAKKARQVPWNDTIPQDKCPKERTGAGQVLDKSRVRKKKPDKSPGMTPFRRTGVKKSRQVPDRSPVRKKKVGDLSGPCPGGMVSFWCFWDTYPTPHSFFGWGQRYRGRILGPHGPTSNIKCMKMVGRMRYKRIQFLGFGFWGVIPIRPLGGHYIGCLAQVPCLGPGSPTVSVQ